MRVLVTGTSGPPVPDGAWPAPEPTDAPGVGSTPPAATPGPGPQDVARWWSASARERSGTVEHLGLAAAGLGFLDALADAAPELLAGVVPGPGAREVPVAVRRDPRTATVYVDASQVPALDLPRGAPGEGAVAGGGPRSSAALGHLLVLAADAARTADGRPGRVVVATGGARSHDAGTGLLHALASHAPSGGTAASGVGRVTPDLLRAARTALRGVRPVAAVATDAPLLGLHGASAALAARGVDGTLAQHLERALGAAAHDVAVAADALDRAGDTPVGGRDLLAAAAPRRLSGAPGTGSGGGAAFALAALGGRLVPALRVVADAVGLDERLAAADLVVVVADALGAHELGEGAVREVARRAAPHAVPVVVVARSVVSGRREQAAAGLSGAYAWGQDEPQDVVERVARTWSRT
ncbi:glycerate kinase [Cellulosimicrobium marinum]|uniref:glycerate kinase n=1 Tax=Cellulosimicrobium marinum TaxID=1638992 RepID=UPI001E4B1FD4|nr:glycerate kinase [Cellulosimicrobium marinum]MCB7135506.1 glycerate kinase [Cellulosimicrobium marinum]